MFYYYSIFFYYIHINFHIYIENEYLCSSFISVSNLISGDFLISNETFLKISNGLDFNSWKKLKTKISMWSMHISSTMSIVWFLWMCLACFFLALNWVLCLFYGFLNSNICFHSLYLYILYSDNVFAISIKKVICPLDAYTYTKCYIKEFLWYRRIYFYNVWFSRIFFHSYLFFPHS